jgi:hypothetical protein
MAYIDFSIVSIVIIKTAKMFGTDIPARQLFLTPEDEAMKHPPNAFVLFRGAIAPANPGMSGFDISQLLGKMWQVSNNATKTYYRKQARLLMDAFKAAESDDSELRHKRQHPRTNIQVMAPIRIKVVLDGGEQQPFALLKMAYQQNRPYMLE